MTLKLCMCWYWQLRTSLHLNRPGASVQSTTGSRVVRISGSNAGYTMIRGSVKSTDYPLHSSVSPSLPLTCVAVCHHISAGLYHQNKHLPGAAHLQERYSRHRKGWPQKYLQTNALVRNSKIPVIKYHSWQVIYFAYFLLDNSSASEFYMPTFRNTLSVPSAYLPAYEDGTGCSETSAYKIQTPGNYP